MGGPPKDTPEFRRGAVEYVVSSGKTCAEVAASPGVNESTLAHWVPDARRDEPSVGERRDEAAEPRARTTAPDPGAPARPDLVGRDFASPVPTTGLVGDVACLHAGRGWLYLATAIDLAARMVAGRRMSERMTADIVVPALEMARGRSCVAGGAIFHGGRGGRHTSPLQARRAEASDVRHGRVRRARGAGVRARGGNGSAAGGVQQPRMSVYASGSAGVH